MPPAGRDTSMRDQDQAVVDKDRRKFTSGLIRAIEELELRRINRTPQQLSDAAWDKLQYDFPLLETEELQALLEVFSASFEGKTGWPCYLLTHKALENISNGARGAASYQPQLTDQEQQVQQLLSESLTNKVLGRTASNGSNALPAQQQQQQQQQPVTQQQLYQQLAAVLLLQYAAKVASLPDQQAWQLLQAYCPEEHQHAAPKQDEHQDAGPVAAAAAAAAAGHAAELPAATGNGNVNSSCSVYDDIEAAQQDGDSEEYEPLEALHHMQQHSISSSALANPAQAPLPFHAHQQEPQQPYSWPALHHKLLSLAEHVHYSLLAYEPLWRQQHAAQHLLQLLRLLGVHSHGPELQPLLHAYVALLVDHLATAPQDLPLLHQLWEALGLTVASGLKQGGVRVQQGGAKPQAQQGLHPEAVLGLSVAAAVWQQLPGVSSRRQLWQLMYDDLLPLLEVCAEQLAYNSSSSKSKPPVNSSSCSTDSAAASASSAGTAFAHVLLLSHVLELLVLGRPSHVDAAKQLTELGVTRSLVQLHVQWGSHTAAEPLRRAVLLACCSSPHAAAWVLAVPSIKQQLQQQCFQHEGPLESHGALWQVLMGGGSASTAQRNMSAKPAAAITAAAAQEAGAQQQLLELLQLQGNVIQQLQRQVVLLQLMVDAQKAAGSRQRLWSEAALAALRKLAAQLKEMDTPGGSGSHAAAAADKGSMSSSDADSDAEHVDCTADDSVKGLKEEQQQHAGVEQLEHRRSAQLQPTVLRLVKELLTQGGGKTD